MTELDMRTWTLEEQHTYAEIQAELNRGIYLTHRASALRREAKSRQVNSRRAGTKRAHVGRSEPSGPAGLNLTALLLACGLGLALWGVLFLLVRWVWEIVGGRV